jgi:hypothetical protein
VEHEELQVGLRLKLTDVPEAGPHAGQSGEVVRLTKTALWILWDETADQIAGRSTLIVQRKDTQAFCEELGTEHVVTTDEDYWKVPPHVEAERVGERMRLDHFSEISEFFSPGSKKTRVWRPSEETLARLATSGADEKAILKRLRAYVADLGLRIEGSSRSFRRNDFYEVVGPDGRPRRDGQYRTLQQLEDEFAKGGLWVAGTYQTPEAARVVRRRYRR